MNATKATPSRKTASTLPGIDEIFEKKLEELTIVLSAGQGTKSQVYDEVLALVERGLIRIALKRNNNVKSAAAAFLGINRNTFQKKMTTLGIPCGRAK
ncbi:MAG: DNA-binding protein Fis [Syntrophaceae bacterium PtaB.Bin038]|jgi:DNA-binding protein Fis|nr:MAG: DNA-binding protein Fis [Syntrophaceae bacterium PtaB.Bin038]